jgi:protocatechuate 3,4-dioxygenase beta subunit
VRARLLAAVLLLASFPALGAVTGTVVGDDGRAAVGATVSAYALETAEEMRERWVSGDPIRKALATTVTDGKGNFSLEVKKPTPVVELRIEGAGLPAVSERAAADEDAGVLHLARVPMIRGTIAAKGKPLAGATVIVSSGGAENVTITDASGRYPLPDPKRRPSHVVVRHPDYAPVEQDLGAILATRPDLAMTTGTALSGRVVAADGETPVANAAIRLDGLRVATSASDGSFTIAHAGPRAQRIAARAGNAVAMQQLGKTRSLLLRMAVAAAIAGTVRDGRGRAIAGVEVTALVPRFGGTDGTAASSITDAKGNYAIAGLAGGEYELTAVHPGYTIPRLTMNLPAGRSVQKAIYAVPLGAIAGSVVDEERRGVAGVQVESRPIGEVRVPMPGFVRSTHPAMTAPDGHFLLRTADQGNLQLEALKKGLPPARSPALQIAAGERKAGVKIVMPRGVALTGRVSDRDGKAVPGATVAAAEPGEEGNGRRMMMNSLLRDSDDLLRTAADGTFSMRVKEGTYDVFVTAAGFAPKTVKGTPVTASSPPLEVTLEPGVEVSGRVTRGGAGVEGVNVFTISGEAGAPVQTAADGTFRIVDLAPGEMMLAFKKIGDFIQTTRAVTAPASGVNVDLPAGGKVSGSVVDKATGQPVQAFDAGISVSKGGGNAVMMIPPVMHGFTSSEGAFTIDSVPAGLHTLAVIAPGYVMARLPNVRVEDGKSVENIEVALESGVQVTGRVTGPDNAPLGGALVRIDGEGAGAAHGAGVDPYTLSDPNGEYLLENVEPGATTLAFSRSGLLPARKSVTLSGPSARVDAQLTAGTAISGMVVLESGAPVADAAVSASSAADRGSGQSTQTDASGGFAISGIAPGHYEIRAGKSGYGEAVLRDVDIATAGVLRLVMKGGGVIAGRVTGLTATELRTAVVQASSAEGTASAAPDSSGSYRLEGAPTGTVRVSARAGQLTSSSRSAPMQSVQVGPGATVTVDFDFSSDLTVSGRVTRGGAPLPGVMIAFAPRSAAQRFARTSADSSGHYQVTGIDDGSYTVTVLDLERGPYVTSYDVSGSATFDIDVHGATLTGRVSDSTTGSAIAGATVEIRRRDTDAPYARTTSSGPNGELSFEQLPPGAYEAKAQKVSYGAATVPVTLGDNGASPVEIKLTPSPGLTLRLADARDGQPLAGWYHAEAVGGGTYDGALAGGSEATRAPLAAGAYRVTVGAAGYASAALTISAPGEQTVGLTPGGTIVVSSTSGTFAFMRILDAAAQPYRWGPGPADGIIRLDPAPGQTPVANVAPGTYTLQLIDNRNNVVRSTQVTVAEGQIVTARL